MNQHAMDCAVRRRALSDSLTEKAFLLYNYEHSDRASLRYLTGFTGEGALIVLEGESVLLSDSRYIEQARRETSGIRIEERREWMGKDIAEFLTQSGIRRVAFPSRRVTHHWVDALGKLGAFELVPVSDPVSDLRSIKTDTEVECLRRAAGIADDALRRLVGEIRVGMGESEIALRLEWLVREAGSEGIAFEVNVSAGENSALNHYSPVHGGRTLRRGDLLLFDFGACVNGYRSDITRTLSVGTPDRRARKIYDLVLQANETAIDAARPGTSGVSLDAVARDVIAGAGYGASFGHGLGHGIGLEVHEKPAFSPQSKDTLGVGMVATVEPGIYLPGFGGVRIEDDIVVTEAGCEVITGFPKDRLMEVGG